MGLKDLGETLPPGFRFCPSDEELVCHYLQKKIANEDVLKGTLVEIDLHTCEPWQLPEVAKLNGGEWYFFSFRDRKYATGFRTNRATMCGYWKATGKDRVIHDPNTQHVVGMRKTLVFYRNRAPNGMKTGWIMHEFRLETPHMPPKEDWVLCRVFHKGKGESSSQSPHLVENSTTTATSSPPPLMAASPPPTNIHHDDQNTMAYGYQGFNSFVSNPSSQTQIHNRSHHDMNAPDHATLLNPNNLLQLLKEGNPNNHDFSFNDMIMVDQYSSKNDHHHHHHDADDQYGFWWDLGFEDNNNMGHHGHHHHHGLIGDMGFEDDNGTVLL